MQMAILVSRILVPHVLLNGLLSDLKYVRQFLVHEFCVQHIFLRYLGTTQLREI